MGCLKSIGTSFIYISTFLAAITFIPGLPPNIETSPYEFTPPSAIKNQQNARLNAPEKLFKGEIKGPESFDTFNGVLYTTLHGGAVSKLVGNKLVEVVRFGKKCDGLWDEERCGRPLGLKFDKNGNLFVTDAYYGVFKVNVKTGSHERIVDPARPISGKRPMIPNSIDVASNGDLYWTDSSTEFKLYDGVYAMLADPSGRLIRYNAALKKNEVLMDKLGFANGVKLSDNESFIIVSETTKSRVQKYYLKGPNAGKSEIFIESLPGLPDNIHSDGNGNFLVSLPISADEEHPQLSQSLAPHPYLRKMLLRLLGTLEAPFKFLEKSYPNYYTKRIIHAVGHFESASFMFEDRVTILRIDPSGKILDVLEADDGQLGAISSGFVFDGFLWLGSFSNDYLGRVPIEKALPGVEDVVKKEKNVVPEGTTTPRPTTTTPRPTTTTPRPSTTSTTPRPTTTTQKPTTTTPRPTTTTQKPATTQKPTTTTQKPTTTTQKPTTTTQKPKTTKKPIPQEKKPQPDVKPVREEPEKRNEKLRDEI